MKKRIVKIVKINNYIYVNSYQTYFAMDENSVVSQRNLQNISIDTIESNENELKIPLNTYSRSTIGGFLSKFRHNISNEEWKLRQMINNQSLKDRCKQYFLISGGVFSLIFTPIGVASSILYLNGNLKIIKTN